MTGVSDQVCLHKFPQELHNKRIVAFVGTAGTAGALRLGMVGGDQYGGPSKLNEGDKSSLLPTISILPTGNHVGW